MGGQLLGKLVESDFQGALYPINPRYETCGTALLCQSHRRGTPIELAVIAIPGPAIPGVLQECGACGVGAAIVIPRWFRRGGFRDRPCRTRSSTIARTVTISLVGPNCLGIIRPSYRLNASFARRRSPRRPGGHGRPVRRILQRHAGLGRCQGFGFSAVASLGRPRTWASARCWTTSPWTPDQSILLYIEGITDARAFLSGRAAEG